MASQGTDRSGQRTPLSQERVLRGAVAVADAGGLGALTIRSLAHHLGVKPMSVYHYVANKEEILDGVVDLVFSEIDLPTVGGEWRSEMHRRAASARVVLRRHPWAVGILESRTNPGPATLRHHDAVLGTLRAAGFSLAMTAHTYALIDSYVYGYALQEAGVPFDSPETAAPLADSMLKIPSLGEHPHFVEMATGYFFQPGYDFGEEFEFGLTLILDAIAQRLE